MSPPGDGGTAMQPAGWRVPFVRPDVPDFAALASAFEAAIASGMLTKGPELRRLEDEAAVVLGVRHVVGVSSCTLGLALVLESLADLRYRRTAGCPVAAACPLSSPPRDGDVHEVILPSFNFLAAPAAVVWAGLDPVFVDVDPETFTVDPAAVAAAITPRTAAVMACHTFGCPCDLPALTAVAERAGVPLMVDAAHGLGTRLGERQVGREGLAQVFSLSPTKLVVAGEGGLVATSSPAFATLLRRLREYGNDGDYDCSVAGLNGRLPELSAALGRVSLARLPEVLARRQAVADAYLDVLRGTPGLGFQAISSCATASWKDFSFTIAPDDFGATRDAVRAQLADVGIDSRAYYSPPCHRMPAFSRRHPADRRLPVTDSLAASSLSLPMGAHVTPTVARMVANEVLAARG